MADDCYAIGYECAGWGWEREEYASGGVILPVASRGILVRVFAVIVDIRLFFLGASDHSHSPLKEGGREGGQKLHIRPRPQR